MFEIGNEYAFWEIKDKLGVKEGSSMLRKGSVFVALCLELNFNFIKPNIMLVKNGSLIRKIGRDLSGAKYPINTFMKNEDTSKYRYIGGSQVIETKTAPTKVKSVLQTHSHINPKDISRLVYLNISGS